MRPEETSNLYCQISNSVYVSSVEIGRILICPPLEHDFFEDVFNRSRYKAFDIFIQSLLWGITD